MVQDEPARANRRNAERGGSHKKGNVSSNAQMLTGPCIDQDHNVLSFLRNQYGDEIGNNMDLAPFTGCYVHSLLSPLYPPYWNESKRIRQNHSSSSTAIAARSGSDDGSSSSATPRGNGPLRGGIRKCNTPQVARNMAAAGETESATESESDDDDDDYAGETRNTVKHSSNESNEDTNDDNNCNDNHENYDSGGDGSNSGKRDNVPSLSPRTVVEAAARTGETETEEVEEKKVKVLHSLHNLPEPILVGPRRSKRITVKNVKDYFSPAVTEGKKGWVYCKVCGTDVWPPNNQKHLYSCFELE